MKTPEVKAAEEADRVQLVEALAEHAGTPWGETIEKVAALRIEHAARGAVIDGLRATVAELRARLDDIEGAYTPKAGAEAEALRQGIERLLVDAGGSTVDTNKLQRLLDDTDARDSVRWLEDRDKDRRERDELRAALLNERGEGEPPSEGWAWRETCWTRDVPSGEQARVSWDATGLDAELPRWRCWLENAEDWSGSFIVPSAPTARDAMRAADAALAGGKS